MESYSLSVKKSCKLLKTFLEVDKEIGVTELSKRLDMSKGGIHKLLITLESEGFIRQNPLTKQYALGYTLLELANKIRVEHDWINVVRPYLEQLGELTKETACLCILDGTEAIYVDRIESQYPIRFNVDVYRRFPLYATSASRVILAYSPESVIEEVLDRELMIFTPYSMKSKEEVKGRLEQIRQQGYEYSSNLRNVGVTGIAAPIFDSSGKVQASISVMGPTDRMIESKDHWIKTVINTTKEISKYIGYKGE